MLVSEDQASVYFLSQEQVDEQLARITDKIQNILDVGDDVTVDAVNKMAIVKTLLDNLEKALYAQITAQ